MKKTIGRLLICAVFALLLLVPASADSLPYDSYIYNNDKKPLEIPAPFSVGNVLTGDSLHIGAFSDISDLFYDGHGLVYICDAGNNRIVVVDQNLKLQGVLNSFDNHGTIDHFSAPTGIYVSDQDMYVADSKNARILVFDRKTMKFLKNLRQPSVPLLNDSSGSFQYIPEKCVVDSAGRIYVVAKGVNQGLIRLNGDGQFSSFMGAPSVVPNFAELIWRKFATKEQRKQLEKIVPTEYNSILIDDYGFIYATAATSKNTPVVRLNSKGDDILPAGVEYGDSMYKKDNKTINPYFVDVGIREDGTYFLLDASQGKIYGYDENGNMLYAFGCNAFQSGGFYSASALACVGDSLFVADQSKGTVTIFKQTEFGGLISQATNLYQQGLYAQSKTAWQKVYALCSNYTPAGVGIASVDIQQGRYTQALSRLESLHAYDTYTLAFEKARDELIREDFFWILLALIGLILAVIVLKRVTKRVPAVQKMRDSNFCVHYRYSRHVMKHPFDGFWDLKREGRGDIRVATTILALFTVLYGIRAQYSGYVVTQTISGEVNALQSCLLVLLPLLLWVVSNWCFTTLMDGKGSMRDIYMATCYALKPYVVLAVPLLILSHILTEKEAMFYFVLDQFCVLWVLALIFISMMVTHDYSLSKAVLAAVLTIIGILLILFILLLYVNVIQNFLQFVLNLYKEFSLRLYE